MSKKSQAALEFLTTYGWAFLVILVMIGALAYFGVLRPSKILPDRCNFGPEIRCLDYKIGFGATGNGDGTFSLWLKNNLGEPIVLQGIGAGSESVQSYSCTFSSPALPYTWGTDSPVDFSFTSCQSNNVGFVKGNKGKVYVNITYYLAKSSSTYTRQVAGEVYSTII